MLMVSVALGVPDSVRLKPGKVMGMVVLELS
jgi:hypothetical protein